VQQCNSGDTPSTVAVAGRNLFWGVLLEHPTPVKSMVSRRFLLTSHLLPFPPILPRSQLYFLATNRLVPPPIFYTVKSAVFWPLFDILHFFLGPMTIPWTKGPSPIPVRTKHFLVLEGGMRIPCTRIKTLPRSKDPPLPVVANTAPLGGVYSFKVPQCTQGRFFTEKGVFFRPKFFFSPHCCR